MSKFVGKFRKDQDYDNPSYTKKIEKRKKVEREEVRKRKHQWDAMETTVSGKYDDMEQDYR